MNILAVYGTRPEYLKIKPLLEKSNNTIKSCHIQQHTNIINFGNPDYEILIEPKCNSRINNVFSEIFNKTESIYRNFDSILVQGDTATVAASAISAFNLKKRLIYLESGLRTHDLKNPFPEEGYRQMVARIADINLCPTHYSASNLKKEKVKGEIYVVGNTVLDNIKKYKKETSYGNTCLVTLHRNENLNILHEWLKEIERFASINKDLKFLFPAHPNPIILKACKDLKHINILEPLEHEDLLNVLKKCKFVITDSGGIQEEASFLNKKIIVCRKNTERPEGIETGHIQICKNPNELYYRIENMNSNFIINTVCPYGDGYTSDKILGILKRNE